MKERKKEEKIERKKRKKANILLARIFTLYQAKS